MGQAMLKVTPELLTELLKGMHKGWTGSYRVIGKGLPDDTKLLGVALDNNPYCSVETIPLIILKLESSSFSKTYPGEVLMELDAIEFKAIYEEH